MSAISAASQSLSASISSNYSTQTQTAGLISSTVTAIGAATHSLSGSVSQQQSNIKQTATAIDLRVTSTEGTASNVAGLAINQQGVTITGDKLEFSGSAFSFGNKGAATENYISGSNGILEIKSSNFHLDTDGDVTMTGTVTADSGHIGGSSNGWTIATSKLSANDGTNYIGLVQDNVAHADVGSVSAFYAGASADTGEDATISFGDDGKIRGTGVYVRDDEEFVIAAEKIFGDGRDGTLYMSRFYSGIPWRVTYCDGDDVGISGGEIGYSNGSLSVMLANGSYGDSFLTFSGSAPSASSNPQSPVIEATITQQRDVYLKKLVISTFTAWGVDNVAPINWDLNGYRLFVQQGIFVCGNSAQSAGWLKFRANGSNGGDGGPGNPGGSTITDESLPAVAGGTAGSAGAGNTNTDTQNLIGGVDGTVGSVGGAVSSSDNSGHGQPGSAYSANNALSTNYITVTGENGVDGSSGASGLTGVTSGTSGTEASQGGSGTIGAGAAAVNASTKLKSIDPHLLTTFRDLYGTSDSPYRIAASTGNGGAGSGGGGGMWSKAGFKFNGGSGGGSGGGGGNGGIAMVVTPIIDYNLTKYGNATAPDGTTPSTSRFPTGASAAYSSVYIQAIGGDGGDGGNGGKGGFASYSSIWSHGGPGGGGAGGAGGNGGTVVFITSNRTPSSGGPLGTYSMGSFANISANSGSGGDAGFRWGWDTTKEDWEEFPGGDVPPAAVASASLDGRGGTNITILM